jgi:hypothetical protein
MYHGFPVRFLPPLAEAVTVLASPYVRISTHETWRRSLFFARSKALV